MNSATEDSTPSIVDTMSVHIVELEDYLIPLLSIIKHNKTPDTGICSLIKVSGHC